MANLYDQLAARFPQDDAPFACLEGEAVISYGALRNRTAQYAGALRALGVGIGDRVAIQAEKSLDYLFIYLATVRAGAVFLPLNTAYTAGEIEYFLSDARPALFICDPARKAHLAPLAEAIGAQIETLDADGDGTLADRSVAQPDRFDTIARSDDDLAAILYTSGTTGRSKGAMITHANLASNAATLVDAWRFTGQDVLLHALPVFHTHGLFVATNVVLASGASMQFLPRFDIAAVLDALPHSTVMMGVPTFYIRLLDDPDFGSAEAGRMRLFISGSAPLSADVHRSFEARTGHAILERYGMTETNMNTSNPYAGERRAGTVGLPLPSIDLRIADPETHAPLADGEVGMIEVRGPNVFSGYWRQPEKTASEFVDGWFVTGDLGLIDDRGYVSIVGRGKDLIISGGYNIYPAEVEALLDEIAGVRESAVIGAPHPDLGEAVVAVIAADPASGLDADRILAQLADRLARFKQPRRIEFVDALPRNSMAKIQKTALRDAYRDAFATG